ncbi:LysR family transcriptional regulator [Salinicola sp. JS01]|uniref:helix-turn-helix domain-containing protein n=1 Tax=Salinicola sp. JS01 TaxID=3050071 RepID=UPI00255B6D3F|nr:LysR family transcriptional regulator [Salinicola sp. JS01]WIX34927.1 LysR family transcriptional regulator [Salinicola sp. JS01]
MSAVRKSIDLSVWGAEPPRWVELLAAEVEATNMTRAAERIGMSRSAVSLALANRYPSPNTTGVEQRVIEALDRMTCPAQGVEIDSQQCRRYRERETPTHNPMAMRAWRACQQCPHHPDNGGDS